MKHTAAFLEWIFHGYCLSDEGNFGRRNEQYEYGLTESQMLLDHYEEALEDAKSFLDSKSLEDVRVIINHYKNTLLDKVSSAEKELNYYNDTYEND